MALSPAPWLCVAVLCVASPPPAAASAQPPAPADLPPHRPPASDLDVSLALADPQDVVVARGRGAALRCAARSTLPGLAVVWLHDGRPVAPDDPRRVYADGGSLLRLPKVAPGKKNGLAGEYGCVASNRAGALRSLDARLAVASIDREIVTDENVTATELQPALLGCYIRSVPDAEIQWKYNSQMLPQNSRYVPLTTGALLITKTLSSDAGSYRCIAKNSILNKTKSSKDITFNVNPRHSEPIKPNFLPLNLTFNFTKLVGEEISLLCPVTGWPIPLVQWKKNDNSEIIGNSSILHLKNLRLKDTGNYTCTASNTIAKISRTQTLEIHEKPTFNMTPASKSVPSARIVRLDCHARGTPEPKIYWLKDGKPLEIGGRIKTHKTGLVISHSFSKDSGLYQCVAVNSAGKIWAASRLEINVSQIRPPENIKCRPYDDTSVCVTWQSPIKNVSAIIAYSVYSFYTDDNMTPVSGPEYVTNNTYQTAVGLKESTNYTFYVRMYIKKASESSEKVTCKTGVRGKRNLDIYPITKTSVELRWSEISMDFPCSGNRDVFIVKWRKFGDSKINVAKSYNTNHVISGLEPGVDYEFRVVPESFSKEIDDEWILYNLQDKDERISQTNVTDDIPLAPEHPEGVSLSPTSVKLNWSDITPDTRFYSICFVALNEKKECEDGKLIKTFANKITITELKPNTQYEFRVRSHYSDEIFGPFSQSIELQTPPDVPSQITELKYKVVNETTVCLKWLPPQYTYGNLKEYKISYTPDKNWKLENWFQLSVPADKKLKDSCWPDGKNMASTFISGLDIKKSYTVFVRAQNEVGFGNPQILMVVTTNVHYNSDDKNSTHAKEQILYHQKVGVIVGVILALFCIFICVVCILLRRRCLKRRAVARTRLAASSNHYPAVAHYASHAGAVQVRLEDPCRADEHEIEHLVSEERPVQVSVTSAHLDTKGNDDFPNGHVNGMAKFLGNGTANMNGHVHITENPQYYSLCDGKKPPKKPHPRFEEDSNSNVKPSKFYDLYRLFETSKRTNQGVDSLDSSQETPLNATENTYLDDTLCGSPELHHRRVSPIIGPNG